MDKIEVTLPELVLISGTRAMFGAGAALLLGDKLKADQRKGAGWALLLVGAVSTIPLALQVFRRK